METIQELIKAQLPQMPFQKVLSDEDYCKMEVDEYNSRDGGKSDLYNCPVCKNKKMVAFISPEYHDFTLKICECDKIRKSLRNIRKSGLNEELQSKTFDSYITAEPWQAKIKDTAVRYLSAEQGKWLYAGGQSGSGKTHICTAVCNEFLKNGKSVKYIMYREFIQKLAANKFKDNYHDILESSMDSDLIYIDDFLKTHRINDEIDYVFDIINFADTRQKKLIISSEMLIGNIADIDNAVASRIKYNSKDFIIQIEKDMSRNYRLKERK